MLFLSIVLAFPLPRSHADDDVSDLLSGAKSAATAPVQATGPTTQGVTDALGTMTPHAPRGSRPGELILSAGTTLRGRLWTTYDTPLRLWIDATKTYTDLAWPTITNLEVQIVQSGMQDDWRWLKEGSDRKIFSGKKYPAITLTYKATLINGQTVIGSVDAPIYLLEENGRQRSLALYKTYKGTLNQTMTDLVYIKSLDLTGESSDTAAPTTTKLPLLPE